MKTQVIRLQPEQVLDYWKDISPALEKALVHSAGETDLFGWFRRLMDPQKAQLWVVMDNENKPLNVTLTQWLYYDTHISLHIVLTASLPGAKWKDYKEAHHVIEDFARYHNARRIEMWGREGWERLLPALTGKNGEKYNKTYVVMSLELQEN